MYKGIIFLFLVLILASCKKQSDPTIADVPEDNSKLAADFDEALEDYYEERFDFFPFEATFVGIEGYNDQLPNTLSVEYRNDVKAFFTRTKDKLASIDKSKLSANAQTSYDVLNWECDIALSELNFRTDLMPLNQFESLHLIMATQASGESAQPFKNKADYENWHKRLDAYATWLDTAKVRMMEGIDSGYVLPKALTLKMIPQFEQMAQQDVEKHLFFKPILNTPEDMSSEDSSALALSYGLIIKDKLLPRFLDIVEFLKNDYLTASRETSGISEIPNGAAYYQHQIKEFTTTQMTAEEIHQLGLNEVARLRKEMETVKSQVGFKGNLNQFFLHVRNNKKLMPFTEPEQVVENFNKIHEKMKPNLDKLFDLKPKIPFEVRRTEAFREASAAAEYQQGAIDGSRPGVFYVPIPNVKKYNTLSDEDLFLHEAIPGHHYQISLQMENDSLPAFRKLLWYSAYGEGWALYTESLGKELGLYTDPYQYFGMLSAEIHRAIRLVVDTGIHAKGWSREKAIKYSLDNEAKSEEEIISEIERYMAWPGQALSYKIGQLKIIELRNKKSKMPGFDIKQFHNAVLQPGCIPLSVLEDIIL
ncbi:MAG TPA: DUF885 domain-containing protein [Saprospiraceae bacterium]|nr:DUF885 domain-containing protein [Saprospiraceae bacterium]HPN70927.1 DUF885 domain-containing protein [Saprospiraceae bacterium]